MTAGFELSIHRDDIEIKAVPVIEFLKADRVSGV